MSLQGQHSDRSILTAIQKAAGTFKDDRVSLSVGIVKDFDEDKATCNVVIENGVVLPNVKLQSSICDGLLIVPKVDSTVYVLTSTYNDALIVQYSDIEKYYLQVGDSSFTVFKEAQSNDEMIVLNDGSYKGLVKVEELVKKMNIIEDDLNNIKQLLQSVCTTTVNEPGLGAPSAFQILMNGLISSWYGSQITDTTVDDLQNKNVTHGKA